MITICFTYFKSLKLSNFGAALYSVRKQDLSLVDSIIIVDNDTSDSEQDIQNVIDELLFPVPVHLFSLKHGDSTRTHSWSANTAVRKAKTPWVLFCRADYLLVFDTLKKFVDVINAHPSDWNGFVTGRVFHLQVGLSECEKTDWREVGPQTLRQFHGQEENYMEVDAGVWALNRQAFDRVNGFDEALSAWGHAQTHFQYKLHQAGTETVCLPEALYYHPFHAGHRDIGLANQQLQDLGINIKDMWARHPGMY